MTANRAEQKGGGGMGIVTVEQRVALEAAGWMSVNPQHIWFADEYWAKGEERVALRATGEHSCSGTLGGVLEAVAILGIAPTGQVLVPVEVVEQAADALKAAVAKAPYYDEPALRALSTALKR